VNGGQALVREPQLSPAIALLSSRQVEASGGPCGLSVRRRYAAEGDPTNAGISLAGMIPIAGMVATVARTLRNAAKSLDDVPAVAKGWRVGDPIPNLTRAGNEPSWTAVRNRYWKNAAARPGAADRYNPENFARMKAGKPPLHHAIPVPKELNHITPRHLGVKHTPKNSQVLWPWDYDDADKFRHYRGPRP
jgi:hypothetical protein